MVATCKRKPTTDERRKTIDQRARGYGYDRRYSRCSPRRRNWKLETRNSKHRSGAEFLCTIILRMIQIQICTRYKVFYTSTNKLIRVCSMYHTYQIRSTSYIIPGNRQNAMPSEQMKNAQPQYVRQEHWECEYLAGSICETSSSNTSSMDYLLLLLPVLLCCCCCCAALLSAAARNHYEYHHGMLEQSTEHTESSAQTQGQQKLQSKDQ